MLNSTSSTPFSDPPHGPPTVTADGQVLACIGGTSGWGALFAFTPEVGSLYPPGRATWSYSFTNSPKYDEMGQGTSPILQADNTAITQITSWIHNNLDRIQENETERDALALRIRDRLAPIRQQYIDFLKRHPQHARARVAYGSFLTHIDYRQGAINQWKQALKTDPKNAAALNNLAIHLGTIALQTRQTRGIQEAFRALDKAIQLNPKEPLYRHNFATLLCSFRQPAARYYKIKPQQITQKAIGEYDAAIKLSPKKFEYAADRAEAFLDLTPFPHAEAIRGAPLISGGAELPDRLRGQTRKVGVDREHNRPCLAS